MAKVSHKRWCTLDKKIQTLLYCLLLLSTSGLSQLIVTGGQTGTQLADSLTGDGITISNVVLNCPGGASGIFDGSNSNIGLDQGVILTTGNINNAAGQNPSLNEFGTDNFSPGDPILDFLASAPTLDACALEFDIVSTCDIIQIAYVFASEEYPNFVGQGFNDIFAFIISGPGIPPGGRNIALIPGTTTPVAINTVNAGMNNSYYVSNPAQAGTTVRYNGFTTPLLALSQIKPCQTYHLKLVIADGTDGAYDSGVFLDLGGIRCFQNRTSVQAEYEISGSDHGVEGCNDVLLNVFRTGDSTVAKTVDFSLAGTATNGVDYIGMPASLVFPPFEDSLGILLSIPNDGLIEGMEFFEIVVRDSLCSVLTTDTLRVSIYDPARIEAGNDTIVCVNSTLTLAPNLSDPGGNVNWSSGAFLDDSTIFSPTFTPPGSGSYTLIAQFEDSIGCPATDTIIITVPPFSIGLSSINVDCFGTNTGSATATVTGTAPFGYVWTDASNTILQSTSNNSGTDILNNLGPGIYTVVITDGEGCSDSLTTTITEPASPLSASISNQVNVLCNGALTGEVTIAATGGTNPYEYSINGSTFSSSNLFTGLAAGAYTVTVRDSNLCLTQVQATITEPPAMMSSILSQSNVDCQGNATGSVTIGVSGGASPYQFAIGTMPFGTNPTFTGLAAGNYTITIQDANSCTQTQAVTITEPTQLGLAITTQTHVDCNGNNTGAVSLIGSGGTAPYQYAIDASPFQNSGNFNNLSAGNYTISIQDDSLCSSSILVTITEPAILSASISNQVNVDCNGASTGSVDIVVSGGTAPYQYSINGGPFLNSSSFSNLSAGAYTVDVEDANSCVTSVAILITEPAVLTIAVTNRIDVDCFGSSSGELSVVGGGGTLPYSFSINGGTLGNSGTFSNLFAGLYTLTVQDAQGCLASVDTVVTTPNGLTGGIDTLIQVLCNGDNTGSITVFTQGGASPYTYSSDGITFGPNPSFAGLSAGPDTITVMDVNACIFRIPFVLTEPALLQPAIATNTPVACNGDNTGSITASASGGVAPYEYSLDGLTYQGATSFSGLAAGNYTLSVRDTHACVQSIGFTITEPAPLAISLVSQQDVNCNGNATGVLNLAGSGGVLPYEYSLNNGPFVPNSSFSGLIAGSYSIRIRDANLCVDSISLTITEPLVLTGNILEQKNVTCFGESNGWIEIGGNGGTLPYSFSIDGITFQNSPIFSSLSAGTYSITIQDDSACQFQVPVTIVEPTALGLSLISQENVDCYGNATGDLEIAGTGGVAPYLYGINGGSPQTSGIFSNLIAGTYSIDIQDDSLCTDTLVLSITEPDSLTLAIDSIRQVGCFGESTGEVWFQAGGGTLPYVYSLSNGMTSTTPHFSGLPAGPYTITVQDDSSCMQPVSFSITEPPLLTAAIAYQINVACHGDSSAEVGIAAQGGTLPYEYALDGGTFGTDSVIAGLPIGTYVITVRDSQGCVFDVPIVISQPPVLTISILDSLQVDCFSNASGAVTVAGAGGTGPYLYSIDRINYQSSGIFQNLLAGMYTITVLDDSSCTRDINIQITEPAPLQGQIANVVDVDCNGNATGLIEGNAAGGTLPYQYALDGGAFQNSGTFGNLAAGVYELVIEDRNGCRDTISSIPVTEPDALTLAATHTDVLCFGENTGTATALPSGGTSPYTYVWEDGQQTATAINLASGVYQVVVQDAQGCMIDILEPVGEPDSLILNLVEKEEPFCDWPNGSGTVLAQGGIEAYTYQWNTEPVQNVATASNLLGGWYLSRVTDANGCTDTLSVFLNNTPKASPDFATMPDLQDSILLSDATIQFQNLTEGGFLYEWAFGDGDITDVFEPEHIYQDPGVYEITLTAYNEFLVCPVSVSKTIHIIPDGVLYIPTAFSPNADGSNDEFFVGGEGIVSLSMTIYDRWGREVGRLSQPYQGWEGRTMSGAPVPEGVYTFVVQAYFNSGTQVKRSGTITLIR